jgi:hypothetical protein
MSNETVAEAVIRMCDEGKSYKEIFWAVVRNNRKMGYDNFETKRQQQKLANGIAQLLNCNWSSTADIPDEPTQKVGGES